MKSQGKDCRFELHHPMSLSDALAALFRWEPRKRRGENAEALFGLGERAGVGEPEPATRKSEEREEADVARLQAK